MNNRKSAEELKTEVRNYLINTEHYSVEKTEEWIKLYEPDFPEFLRDNWSLSGIATAMRMGY